MSSGRDLAEAGVRGFSPGAPHAAYCGSFLWMLVLLSAETSATMMDEWDAAAPVLYAAISFNVCTFAFQTVDYVWFHFYAWPVTALNWTAQLSALGAASVLVSYAFADKDKMMAVSIAHLVGQALFTASQFAVTLEYFARRLGAPRAAPREATPAPRLSVSRNAV